MQLGEHDTLLSVLLIFQFAFIYVFQAQQLPPHLTEELLVCSLPLLPGGCISWSTWFWGFSFLSFFFFLPLLLKEHPQKVREG